MGKSVFGKSFKDMERRLDVTTHPDDIKKPRKPYKKRVLTRRKKPDWYKDDAPWVEDKKVFSALNFVRSLINDEDDPLPIELAIYKSAKYYKIPQNELAKECGRLGSFVREKKKSYRY